jgi:hypothetical protein
MRPKDTLAPPLASENPLTELRALRDAIKGKARRWSLDIERAWGDLESRSLQVERALASSPDKAIGGLRESYEELRATLKSFYDSLR